MKFEKFVELLSSVAKVYEPTITRLRSEGNGVIVQMLFDDADDHCRKEINSIKGVKVGKPEEYGIRWEVKVTGVKITPYGFGTKCLETEDGAKYYDVLDIIRSVK